MIRPEELIGQLLLRHNCVIVPGFGGFVAQRVAAVVDPEKGLMMPPKKTLLFNRQLINNDGLLTSELATAAACSYEEAGREIQSMVQSWNSELARGARVNIDKVGFLFFDQERNLCFEQDRFFNLLLESFGLGKVYFVVEEQKKEAKIIELNPVTEELTEVNTQVLHSKRSVWKYVAAACILPVAFYSFWIPAKTNVMESGMFSVKDFNPFFKNKPAQYQEKELTPVQMNADSETSSEVRANYEFIPGVVFPIKQDAPSETIESAPSIPLQGKQASKQFIVGCFGSEENVELMLSKLRSTGLDAYVYDTSNGLKRVSAGGSELESEMQEIRQKVAAIGVRGWIFRSN